MGFEIGDIVGIRRFFFMNDEWAVRLKILLASRDFFMNDKWTGRLWIF